MKMITLQCLAAALDVSDDTLRRKLKRWGLLACRYPEPKRPATFDLQQASEILQHRGFIDAPLAGAKSINRKAGAQLVRRNP